MSRLLLVRHGQTEWNALGLYHGHLDAPLTDLGFEQSRAVARALEDREVTRLVTSILGRALETARIIGEHLGLGLTPDRRLRELDMGRMAGHPPSVVHAQPGYRKAADWRWPGGETFDELQARVLGAARAWSERGGTSLLVTHAGPIRALLRHARGLSYEVAIDLDVDPTEIYELSRQQLE